jgi:hypothetical protein
LDVKKTTKQRFRGPFPEPKGAQTFRTRKSKKKSLYIYTYTHMVVHTSMYDGEEA